MDLTGSVASLLTGSVASLSFDLTGSVRSLFPIISYALVRCLPRQILRIHPLRSKDVVVLDMTSGWYPHRLDSAALPGHTGRVLLGSR